jgi:hypothetical protein
MVRMPHGAENGIGTRFHTNSKAMANTLLAQDRNGDGIANAFDYAFGTNLNSGVLLNIRMVDGEPRVEIAEFNMDEQDEQDEVRGVRFNLVEIHPLQT